MHDGIGMIGGRTISVPRGYGNDLIGAQLQASVCAGRVMTQQNIHYRKKLFNALILAEILTSLYQEGVVPLVIPANDKTLWPTDR